MIVLSVALVVMAAVLLIVGIITKGVVVIYLSIAASAAAAALLFLGVRGSRPNAEGSGESLEPSAPALRRPVASGGGAVAVPVADDLGDDGADIGAEGDASSLGSVMVVSGRPRYHRSGCRFLSGREDAEQIPVEEAREVGFTPCGVCKPDEALAVAAVHVRGLDVERAEAQWTGAGAPVDDEGEPPVEPVEDRIPPAGGANASPADRSTLPREVVVVIPDRGKYHRAECRFVRNVEGTMSLTRDGASQKGYGACGVCKP